MRSWQKWLAAGGLFVGGIVVSPMIRNAEAERQPAMQQALKTLQVARQKLEAATADKGGHRVKAIALVDEAIAEVKAGIKFDNQR